jgi:hypothetical protein
MIKYLNSGEDYPILKNKFALSFQGGGETLPPFIGDPDVIEWNGDNRVTPRTFDKRRFKNE